MSSCLTVKCRKCRYLLLEYPQVNILTAHGESCGDVSVQFVNCETIREDNIWFLGDGDMPEWISSIVNETSWTKGKMNCPKCNSRLGSFDFVSGIQCQCGGYTLPPIHIVKCKVDSRFHSKDLSQSSGLAGTRKEDSALKQCGSQNIGGRI